MIPIKTKEHLVYFMQCGMMRLSKYDLRFVQNLQMLSAQNLSITTNQVELFEKLVAKYKRQLAKHNLTTEKLSSLVWETKIVSSDPTFTEAYVSIQDNVILFRAPFSKKFIEQFRKIEYNSFRWIKDKKIYESPFSGTSLKYLLETAHDVYPVVNYCPIVSGLLNKVEEYSATYWNPTLVKCNDRFVVAATNQHLDSAIANLELSDDPECLSILASYGVEISDDIINSDPFIKFAGSFSPVLDLANIDDIVDYLHKIKCDAVFMGGKSRWKLYLVDKIKDNGLYLDDRVGETIESRLEGKKNPVLLYISPGLAELSQANSKFRKVVKLCNSNPVVVK